MNLPLPSILLVFGLFALQVLAALPWAPILLLSREQRDALRQSPFGGKMLSYLAGALGAALLAAVLLMVFVEDKEALEAVGQVFAAALQLSLLADLFVVAFVVLLMVWPKGGAVALAAFREGVRQPLFWLVFAVGFLGLTVWPFLPYFTFGEDYVMVKELGFDTIMICAVAFGAFAASLSISEEIEGRTAVTLMSKPVSRRQFLLGKFAGILLAAVLMIGLLGVWFEGVLIYKRWFEKMDPEPPAAWITGLLGSLTLPGQVGDLLRGILLWTNHTMETLPGLILNLSEVMVLVALAVSLATRLPMIVNLSTVLVIYFLGHLAPVLVAIGHRAQEKTPGAVSQMLSFMAQLFDTILPGLDYFRVGPALVSDMPLATPDFFAYVARVSVYGLLYTAILLLLGLILFEDRDLA